MIPTELGQPHCIRVALEFGWTSPHNVEEDHTDPKG